jgi:hypothetical protein
MGNQVFRLTIKTINPKVNLISSISFLIVNLVY